jgi:hypothetical protein
MYADMEAVKRANEANGYHWFDAETTGFFGSRYGRTLYGGRYFVSSEQDRSGFGELGSAWGGERRYTIRIARDDGSIEDAGPANAGADGFGYFDSGKAARRAILAAIESGRVQVVRDRYPSDIEREPTAEPNRERFEWRVKIGDGRAALIAGTRNTYAEAEQFAAELAGCKV